MATDLAQRLLNDESLRMEVLAELACQLSTQQALELVAILTDNCDRPDGDPEVAKRLRACRTYALEHTGIPRRTG